MVYISLSSSSQEKIVDAIEELYNLGFTNIELGGGKKYCPQLIDDIFALKEKYGINFLLHSYFPPPAEDFVINIASKDQDIRKKTFDFIQSAIQTTKKFGNGLYTIHPGFNKSVIKEKDGLFFEDKNQKSGQSLNTKEDFYRVVDSLKDDIVNKEEIKVGIENFFPFSSDIGSFLDDQGEIFEFLDRYKENSNIGMLLDLGHLNISATKLGFDKFKALDEVFRNYAHKIFEIHISENDGIRDMHTMSELDSWQVELVRKNKKMLSNIPIVFEWRNINKNIVYQRFKILENILENGAG